MIKQVETDEMIKNIEERKLESSGLLRQWQWQWQW
jgi:hypothetical protein